LKSDGHPIQVNNGLGVGRGSVVNLSKFPNDLNFSSSFSATNSGLSLGSAIGGVPGRSSAFITTPEGVLVGKGDTDALLSGLAVLVEPLQRVNDHVILRVFRVSVLLLLQLILHLVLSVRIQQWVVLISR
jgi:hypothetical protein